MDDIPKDSVVLTNLFLDNNNIKWFNNKSFNLQNSANSKIIEKNIMLFKLKKIELHNLNIFDIIYLIKYECEDIITFYKKNNKVKNIKKKFKNIKNCTIIGSGKNHIDYNFINSSDVVIRTNGVKLDGYENIVGNKTDIYFKGGSLGMPDSKIFNDPEIIKLTSEILWNKDERQWLYSGYYLKYNWFLIFRKLHFSYFKDLNLEVRKNFGFFNSGSKCLLIALTLLFSDYNKNPFQIYISGFSFYKDLRNEYKNNNFTQVKGYAFDPNIKYEDESWPYYYKPIADEFRYSDPNNSSYQEAQESTKVNITEVLFSLLLENEIIFSKI